MSLIAESFNKFLEPISVTVKNYFKWKGSDNPEVDLMIILALLDGICFHYLMDPHNYPLKEIKERIYKMI